MKKENKTKTGYEVLVWCRNNPMKEYIWSIGTPYKERYNDVKKVFECFSSANNEWTKNSITD